MSATSIFLALGIAMAFAGWPIVANYANVSGGWAGTVVSVTTTIVLAVYLMGESSRHPTPELRAFLLLGVAGIVNGIAVYYYAVKATDPTMSPGAFVVVVSILIAVWAPILNWALNSEIPNLKQALGFNFAAIAIYLLSR